MSPGAARYAPRATDEPLIARAEYLLSDAADATPHVLVLLGPAGNGARTTLLRGVAPRLSGARTQIHGEWDPDAVVQVCAASHDVPPEPPPATSRIRVVLIAAHRLDALPEWVRARRAPELFTLGPLSLGELGDFLEARLGGAVDAGAGSALAHAAGAVPAMLAWLVDTLRSLGRLEVIDGLWQLTGSVETEALTELVSARLAALGDGERLVAQTIALGEPCAIPADRAAVATLEAMGAIEAVAGERVAFRSPLIADAVRVSAFSALADSIHRRGLGEGATTPQAMAWMLEHGAPMPVDTVRDTIQRALDRRDGAAALRLVDAALAFEPSDGELTAWLHLRGAEAARRLPDADRAAEHLQSAAAFIEAAPAASALRVELAATAAEVRGYVEGNADAALAALRACTVASARERADLAALEYLQLAVAGRLDEADEVSTRHGGFRGARPVLRARARLAGNVALVARGRPQVALRRTLPMLARQTLAFRPHPEVTAEAQIAYVVAALGSDGPAAFPALARQFEAPQEHGYRPDLVGFACTRATWELAKGDVGAAQRIALPALGTSEFADASGVGPLLTALLASCSALLGDRESAAMLAGRLAGLLPRVSRMTQGAIDAHEVVRAFCLGDAAAALARERGMAHLAAGRLGFASEVFHAAVRFGDLESARALTPLSRDLDGRLHGIRVDHARALVAADAVQLVAVAEQFRRAGLVLHAAEAGQQALACEGVPASLARRARSYAAQLLAAGGLPGHPLLSATDPDTGAASSGATLTPREAVMLRLIEAGLSNADIAASLHLSLRTVEGHITRLYRKIGGARRAPARRLDRA